ncbi:MAG TPA: hypothetical protein VGS07_11370 [Thermoanaerobaculia bacterium]|nr:hypothetical protein [Thermoanaerobaculia bacterium]
MWRFSLVFAILAVIAVPGFATTTSFTVTVPDRVNGSVLVPIARVRLTLEGVADAAGATLNVQNGALNQTLNLDNNFQLLDPAHPSTSDFVKFQRDGSVLSRVHIELVLRHIMSDPANFCVLGITGPQTYAMSFNGPAVTGHRISSYGVGGLVSASTPTECTLTKRRIASTPATVAGLPNPLGRMPLDIVLVLDESGSMALDTPGDMLPEQRMAVLRSSAQQFLALWETEPSAGGTNLADDRMGLVYFSTDLDVPFPGVPPTTTSLIARGSFGAPNAMHPWNPINTAIGTHGPTNSTAIGKGLQAALDTFSTDPNDPSVILMTDGLQNVDPQITRSGMGPSSVMQLSGTDLRAHGVPVITVSLGIPGGVDPELLDDVARQTAGRSRLTATSVGTANAFASGLVTALQGNTLLVATEGNDSIPAGAPAGPPVSIPFDASIRRVAFVLGWSGDRRVSLDLEIAAPGGSVVTPATRADGLGWTVQGIDIPSTGPAGTWTVRVIRRPTPGTAEVPRPEVQYHLGAYTYEGKLDYQSALPAAEIRTGDGIAVRTEISFAGTPVTTAEGHVTLRVARPGESFGNILHDTDVDPSVLTTEPLSGDKTSPYQRKVFALTKTLVHRIEPAVLPGTLQLHHDGHGLYSATFSDTSKPGLYQFLLTYEFDAPDGSGRIRRIEHLERVLKLKPDASATSVVVTPGRGGQAGTYTVVVTPKDRFGNYMGPGAPGRISIAVNGVGTVSAISDPKQTGDYVATITGVPAGTVPEVHVTVDEVQVPIKSNSATSKFRVFLDAGPNFPHGDFGRFVDGRFSVNAGLEGFVASNTSIEGIVGYHAFKVPFVDDPHIWQLSVNLKQYFGPGPLHFFINGGGGAYRFDPGSTTKFGGNVGAGLLYDMSSTWGLEGVYNFHTINTSGESTRFSTVQVGIRHSLF